MRAAALFVLLLAAAASPAQTLSPPWYQAVATFKAALAADQLVETSTESNGSALILTVRVAPCCGLAGGRRLADQACAADCPALRWKARSLSTLLTAAAKARSATLPVKLAVRVLHNGTEVEAHRPPRTLGVAIGALRSAMLGNSYFVSAAIRSMLGSATSTGFAVFQPKVAQIYADDLSEQDGLQTLTIATLMEQALNLGALGIKSTTKRCDGVSCLVTT